MNHKQKVINAIRSLQNTIEKEHHLIRELDKTRLEKDKAREECCRQIKNVFGCDRPILYKEWVYSVTAEKNGMVLRVDKRDFEILEDNNA